MYLHIEYSTYHIIQGFEWNKYNQTHYDTDNPPPKIVQGYKFNVSIYIICAAMHSVCIYVCVCGYCRIHNDYCVL